MLVYLAIFISSVVYSFVCINKYLLTILFLCLMYMYVYFSFMISCTVMQVLKECQRLLLFHENRINFEYFGEKVLDFWFYKLFKIKNGSLKGFRYLLGCK